jgi:hypothetical protein
VHLQWCFVFDNSGSMIRLADACAVAIVLLVELFRKLEISFAIATMGDANRARVLKDLHEPFSHAVGERILAGLTFTEGSQIASCAQAIASRVFPEDQLDSRVKRVMVFVTDGLSAALSEANFVGMRIRHDLELAVLHTPLNFGQETLQRSALEHKLKGITNELYFNLSQSDASAEGHAAGAEGTLLVLRGTLLVLRGTLLVLRARCCHRHRLWGRGNH